MGQAPDAIRRASAGNHHQQTVISRMNVWSGIADGGSFNVASFVVGGGSHGQFVTLRFVDALRFPDDAGKILRISPGAFSQPRPHSGRCPQRVDHSWMTINDQRSRALAGGDHVGHGSRPKLLEADSAGAEHRSDRSRRRTVEAADFVPAKERKLPPPRVYDGGRSTDSLIRGVLLLQTCSTQADRDTRTSCLGAQLLGRLGTQRSFGSLGRSGSASGVPSQSFGRTPLALRLSCFAC